MNRTIQRLMLLFAGLFVLSCVLVFAYQLIWVLPEKRCASHDAWWDPATRVCATPIYLPDITHRPIGAPKITPLAR